MTHQRRPHACWSLPIKAIASLRSNTTISLSAVQRTCGQLPDPASHHCYTVRCTFFSAISGTGHQRGSVNYKNQMLIKILKDILPNGELAWQASAIAYQQASSKEKLRDWDDTKKHWIQNSCNGMKRRMGSTGGVAIASIHSLPSKNQSWIRCMWV